MSRARLAVLSSLSHDGPATRPELASRTGISLTAVHTAVGQLLSAGVLSQTDQTERTGPGRPSSLLSLDAGAAEILAVDLGGDEPLASHQALDGETVELDLGLARSDLIANGPTAVASAVAEKGWPTSARLKVLALAVPGIVSANKKTLVRSGMLGWRDVDLAKFGVASGADLLVVENDADAVTWGEFRHCNDAEGCQPFLCIRIHVGIGAGLVTAQRLLSGAEGAAGEVGYSLLDTGQGRRVTGQLEEALFSRLSAVHGEGRTEGGAWVGSVFQDATSGRQEATRAVRDAVTLLAVSLSSAVTLVNPAKVVVHWSVPQLEELVLAPLQALWDDLLPIRVELVAGRLGSRSAIVGLRDLAMMRVRNRLSRLAKKTPGAMNSRLGVEP